MDPLLQKQIFDISPCYSKNCKDMGIQCGDGWFNIIDKLNFKITKYLNKYSIKNFKIEGIGEILGGLKIDTNIKDDTIEEFINEAIMDSYNTCEYCGEKASSYNISGWIITLCENCFNNPPSK